MWRPSETTLGDLIRSERVLPGALANIKPASPGVISTLAAWAGDLDISGNFYSDGPLGATLCPDEATIRHYSLAYGKSWLPLDYAILSSGLENIRIALERKMPMFTVREVNGRIVVRWRKVCS